jgi:amphi-Trp domain-containing protein
MKRKKAVLIKSKERKNIEEVADFLHAVADKLVDKKLVLQRNDEEASVTIANNVLLGVKVTEKQKKRGMGRMLKFKIKWSDSDENGVGLKLG